MKVKIMMITLIHLLIFSCMVDRTRRTRVVTFKNIKNLPYGFGGGGAVFSETKNPPYALVGLRVRHGSLIDSVTPIYGQLKADGTIGSTVEGHRYGGMGGRETILTKPGYVVVGLSFRSGSYVDQLRVTWQRWSRRGPRLDDEVQSQIVGGSGGSPGEVKAPRGHVVVGIRGRSGSLVDRLSLITAKPVLY